MNTVRFFLKNIGSILFSLLAIVTITFYLMHWAPGNFLEMQQVREAMAALDSKGRAAQKQYEEDFIRRYALDKPVYQQVAIFLSGAVQFKFGPSFANPNVNIEDLILDKLPVTISVVCLGLMLAIILGIPLGIFAALRKNTPWDYGLMSLSMLGQVIPGFVIAVGLIVVFSVGLGWLPTSGWGHCRQLILPSLALGAAPTATVARFIRSGILETLEQDYIKTAFAKGLPESRVILQHTLRNSLIPLVTIMGPQFSYMLMGSVLIEQIFRLPGLGSMFVVAGQLRDYPLLVTATLLFAALIMLVNLLVDISYTFLDPRIKLK